MEESPNRSKRPLVLTYLALALLTFGYVAHANYPAGKSPLYVCDDTEMQIDCSKMSPMKAADYGLFAGAAWPLYWTWTAFDLLGKAPKQS